MLASVANNEDDDRTLVKIVRHAQSSSEICASRTAAKNSFQAPKHPRHLKRFTVRDVDHFVDVLDVHVRRNNLLTDALDEIRSSLNYLPGLFISLEDRAIRIGADDPDARVLLFQIATGTGDRAARSESRYEVCDLSFSLSPQLRTGRAIMRLRICRVRILIGIK